MRSIRRFAAEENGQTFTEYALLIGFLLLSALGLMAGFSQRIAGVAGAVNANLVVAASTATDSACRTQSNCDPAQPGAGDRKIWSKSE